MLRIVLGAIVGFVIWSILWLGSDTILAMFSDWYGQHQAAFEVAVNNRQPFTPNAVILIVGLIRSIFCSVVSGFLIVFLTGENTKAPLILGILLLVFGIFVEASFWNYVPLWYQIPFLSLLIPMAFFGGKLKTPIPARPVLRS